MIRTEQEYKRAVQQLSEREEHLTKQEAELRAEGLKGKELKRALDPIRSFCDSLQEEIEEYERLKRGEIGEYELQDFNCVGKLLIRLRIASGLSQKEFADRLGVDQSQVSRDERNEYHGITLERVSRVLESLGMDLRSVVRPDPGVTV